MRILQIVKGLDIGGKNGGSEKFGAELARVLPNQSERVSLCAFYRHDTPIEQVNVQRLERVGVRVFFAMERADSNPYLGFKRLAADCAKQQVQVVHSHFQVGSLAALYARTSGCCKRILRTAHITKEWGDGLIPWLSRQMFTGLFFPLGFDAEVGVSQAITEQLNRRLAARLIHRRAVRIYNALPEDLLDGMEERVQARWGTVESSSALTIGSVGRLTPRKGYRYLIEAAALLKDELPHLRWVLVGDGEQRQALEAQARTLGLAERVEFVGQQDDIPAWLRKMDLFVLPSLQEGLPTVILESMACGTPVVATDIPGTRELVDDSQSGWLVPAQDAPALAAAIQAATSDSAARRRFALAGIETARRFNIQTSAALYLKLYHELVG